MFQPEILVCIHPVLVHDELNRGITRLGRESVSWLHVALTHRVWSSAAESSCSVHPVPNQEDKPGL